MAFLAFFCIFRNPRMKHLLLFLFLLPCLGSFFFFLFPRSFDYPCHCVFRIDMSSRRFWSDPGQCCICLSPLALPNSDFPIVISAHQCEAPTPKHRTGQWRDHEKGTIQTPYTVPGSENQPHGGLSGHDLRGRTKRTQTRPRKTNHTSRDNRDDNQ